MLRPTTRTVWLFALGVPLGLFLVIAAENLWPLIPIYLVTCVVLIAADGILGLRPRHLDVEWRAPGALYTGRDGMFEVVWRPDRPGYIGGMVFALDLAGPIVSTEPVKVENLKSGFVDGAAFRLTPHRRGTAEIERLWIRWTGPLGLMWRGIVLGTAIRIPIVPDIIGVREAALRLSTRDSIFGLKVQRHHGDGSEFEALREYVPGLDPRGIDWKRSARHRALVCKEFQTERNHHVVLAFDSGHLMSETVDGQPRLDHAINAGLITAYGALRHGDRVGVFAFDSQVRMHARPVGGVRVFPRIQRAVAEIDYAAEETNFTLGLTDLAGRLDRRTLVILMTDFVDTVTAELMIDNVARLTRRHLVLFVTLTNPMLTDATQRQPKTLRRIAEATVSDDLLIERRIVLSKLRRMGVHCLEAPRERIGAELINRYLAIKRRELL